VTNGGGGGGLAYRAWTLSGRRLDMMATNTATTYDALKDFSPM